MIGFLKSKLVSFVITLVLGQIPIFKEGFSWEKFKETIKRKVPEWVPGTWLDGAAVQFSLVVTSVFEEAVTQDALKHLVSLVIDGKLEAAWKYIQERVIAVVMPSASLAELTDSEKESMFERALAAKISARVDTAQA